MQCCHRHRRLRRADFSRLRAGGRQRHPKRHAPHLPADGRNLHRLLLPADPSAAEEAEGRPRDAGVAGKRQRGRHGRRHPRAHRQARRPVCDRRGRAEHADGGAALVDLAAPAQRDAEGPLTATMNRYPAWKYVIIAVALVVGFLYMLPNFFPEVPAVQVSSSKSNVKIDTALLATIEDTLKAAKIEYRGEELDPVGIKVRFNDYDAQLKAKDLLQAKLGDNYIVALNLLSSSPHWLTSIGALPMYLGLDLRGGVHFTLQVDMNGALKKAADRYTTDIRSLMRENRIIYSGVGREGNSIVLRFKDAAQRQKARFEIAKNFPDLQLQEQDAAGGDLRLAAALSAPAQKRIQEGAVQQNITILRNRVNELGVAEPIIQQAGSDRVVVQLPGVQDTARAKDILGRTATLEIRMVNEDPGALQQALAGSVPFGSELLYD